MKAIGLIVEYNPLHNGHAYHIQASKHAADADVVICVMSGYFLQRGEPAILPRRTRAEMALRSGADLIIELPYAYSSQHAHWFARGAVSILDDLGAEAFYFGSESGNTEHFLQLVEFMENHAAQLQKELRCAITKGISYPAAQAEAFLSLNPPEHLPDLSKPNNILGYHYVKATRLLETNILPKTITRVGAGFHDHVFQEDTSIASATAIRKMLVENANISTVRPFLPAHVYDTIEQFQKDESPFYQWEAYYPYLQWLLSTRSAESLAHIYEAEEGLENRFIQAALKAPTFQAFMQAVKTKRYTWTRLQRLAVHLLTGTTKAEIAEAFGESARPQCARILGFTQSGRGYLNIVKKHTPLSLYDRPPKNKNTQQWLDERAARAYYSILSGAGRVAKWKEEYTQPPLYLKEEVPKARKI
ncbi:putative nucleotidyltransferase [Geomicrobium halophilum]|uniref:tRNA(Met) cytidine acetate ligase n=1 Tax=Geomicrobium halophilum TaxID=549000 RepID=A0A841PKV1_9BACL|nr:nucleotidyltransferase [Geomicrobium halophilum]MBB6449400.1 putative nucleotidyltransferase [Geomicrobium halophilum]